MITFLKHKSDHSPPEINVNGSLIFIKIHIYFFKRFYLFIFRERGREGERVGEKHQCVVASCVPPTGDLAHSPGMCPDWESNQRPLVCRLALNPLSHTIQSKIHTIQSKIHIS